MSEHHTIERKAISDAILKGSRFLLSVQNEDGGIEFENEKSELSGIWVTAEALEFFLSSRIVPITIYDKVIRMIKFLLDTQNPDGSWNMLAPEGDTPSGSSSIISTGHCIYVLRLAISDEYMPDTDKISAAIVKAKKWLLAQKIEKNKRIYWAEGAKKSDNPDKDVSTRMEVIFTSYYALMGFLSNTNGFGQHHSLNRSEKDVLKKVAFCFVEEAKWFINQYQSKVNSEPQSELAQFLSTFSRITNALFLLDAELGENYFMQVKEGLLALISNAQKSACFTTYITVGTLGAASGFYKVYNNNTPYDVSMTLLRLEDNVDTIVSLLDEFLSNQISDGSWYLNFSEAKSIKTWTTAEALICLELAFEKYDLVATAGLDKYWKQQVSNAKEQLNEANDRQKTLMTENMALLNEKVEFENALATAKQKCRVFKGIIGIMLIPAIYLVIKWIINPANEGTPAYNLFVILIIPFVIGVLTNPVGNWVVRIAQKNKTDNNE